jgi:hypothetical protein
MHLAPLLSLSLLAQVPPVVPTVNAGRVIAGLVWRAQSPCRRRKTLSKKKLLSPSE